MQADIRWLDDPRVFRVNKVPAHSDHMCFASMEDFATGKSALKQTLDGMWRFAYSKNSRTRPVKFYEEDYDISGFDSLFVPGHIEFAGYASIQYINTMYPWEGKVYRRPPFTGMNVPMEGLFSETNFNPVGSYRTVFDLRPELRGKRVSIRFEGVEQAAFVWLNGQFVGYTEDSFSPAEFDLTPYIRDFGNVLAVEVHKRCSAAYLEDQDFFRFFGIFRSVSLLAKGDMHVEDLHIMPDVDLDTRAGKVKVDIKLSGNLAGSVGVAIREKGEEIISMSREAAEMVTVEMDMPQAVKLWDHHTPNLYQLVIILTDENGEILEITPYNFGFRKLELGEDKVVRLNGKRLIINGINRHEWNCKSGRCITDADEEFDIDFMKRNFINAVRTCHYPDRLSWYRRCDEAGIYMMAETNLETHGTWQKNGYIDPSYNVPGNFPEWEPVVLDRAQNNYETFKNHVSILFWSLGNESYGSNGIAAINAYYKSVDPERLTHYESVYYTPEYKDRISDMESRMYAPPHEVREYLEKDGSKPYILCEYMHSMGNSLGGLDSYYKLVDEFPQMMGGFIWDYIDQAIQVKDEITGRLVMRYGGDFDDRPSNYEFSGNGVLFADRTEKPCMQEVKYYYEQHD